MSKARLLSFWEGPVTWVERLCVASMLQQGHELTIYTFDPEALSRCNLGADIRHVSEVLSEKHLAHRYYAAGKSRTSQTCSGWSSSCRAGEPGPISIAI